jgi:preprotein translocase subunit SecE
MAVAETRKMEKGEDGAGATAASWLPRKLTQLRTFFGEVRGELKKVTWPTRAEVYATTIVVILTTVFFGFYLFGLDLALSYLAKLILK